MPQTPETELNNLAKQIAELTDKRDKLEAKQRLLEAHPLWQLAEEHHAATCHHNHADQCDWYYCEWGQGNMGYAKQRSLQIVSCMDHHIANRLHLSDQDRHDLLVLLLHDLKPT